MARLSAIISNLSKFIKHDKLNAAFLHEIVIIFSKIYLSEVILMTEFLEVISDAIIIP